MKALTIIFFLLIFDLISICLCQDCPGHCICQNETVECIDCKPGYYNLSSNCSQLCDKCPNKECFNDGNCTNQEADCEGKTTKGIDCQTQCSENATENCVECERNGKCSKCKDDKYFGNLCESPCENCPGGECNTEGKCKNTTEIVKMNYIMANNVMKLVFLLMNIVKNAIKMEYVYIVKII